MSREATSKPRVQSERAQWAWTNVQGVGRGEVGKDYATHVRKLPARIQVNGLGQALAFLFAKRRKEKGESGAGVLLLQLGERIATLGPKGALDPKKPEAIMRALVDMTPDQYRRCTHELLVTAEWLKRFVDGLFEKDEA